MLSNSVSNLRPPPASEQFGEADYHWFEQRVESRLGVRLSQYKPTRCGGG